VTKLVISAILFEQAAVHDVPQSCRVNVPHTVAVVHSLADQSVAIDTATFNAQKAFGGSAEQALAAEKKYGCRKLYKLSPASLIQAKIVASSSSSSSIM
jgi:hypothetical protein